MPEPAPVTIATFPFRAFFHAEDAVVEYAATFRSLLSDDADLNFDKIIDEVAAEMPKIFSGAVKHIPLCAVDGEGGLRGGLAFRGEPCCCDELHSPRDVLSVSTAHGEIGRAGSGSGNTFDRDDDEASFRIQVDIEEIVTHQVGDEHVV